MTRVLVSRRTVGLARRLGSAALYDEIDRIFDELCREFAGRPAGRVRAAGVFAPPVDVAETEDEIRVSAELPGIGKGELEVALEDGVLSIRGQREPERAAGEPGRGFRRAVRLPAEVDEDAVKAVYEAGILTVTLPKRRAVEPGMRSIPITTG